MSKTYTFISSFPCFLLPAQFETSLSQLPQLSIDLIQANIIETTPFSIQVRSLHATEKKTIHIACAGGSENKTEEEGLGAPLLLPISPVSYGARREGQMFPSQYWPLLGSEKYIL